LKEVFLLVHMRRVAPVFPVRDVDAALRLYKRLGFRGEPYEVSDNDGFFYGYLSWDDVVLHLKRVSELDPLRTTSACYIWVYDADALYQKWSQESLPGRLHAPEDTAYGLRELGYVDPDGNLLRIGSEMCGDRKVTH
jgi:catechol 2,3-dioxygenase-like lactoylglutathione lyase family enzyme